MYASTPSTERLAATALLDRERFVDQLLAVRDFLRELLVGALLRDGDPVVVLGRRERHDLDVMLLERLHHLVVEAPGFLLEIILCFLAGGEERLPLLLVEAIEGLLRHEHRLVHEP